MAVTVDEVVPVSGDDEAGKSFVDQLPQEVRTKLHITVGTANGDIRPFEAHALVNDWRNGKRTSHYNLRTYPQRAASEDFFENEVTRIPTSTAYSSIVFSVTVSLHPRPTLPIRHHSSTYDSFLNLTSLLF
jgi:hypothetical protein